MPMWAVSRGDGPPLKFPCLIVLARSKCMLLVPLCGRIAAYPANSVCSKRLSCILGFAFDLHLRNNLLQLGDLHFEPLERVCYTRSTP